VRALIANCIMPCRMQIYLSPAAKRNCPRPNGARRRRALNARARARVTVTALASARSGVLAQVPARHVVRDFSSDSSLPAATVAAGDRGGDL